MEAVLRSCKDLSAFLLRLKIRDIFFEKQCCAVAWTKGIHPASEKISKKQCCAVAPTYSAFLLELNFGHIFFQSSVALLHGIKVIILLKKKFLKSSVAQLHPPTQLFC